MFTYSALIGEIEETTALRRILPADSEILAATEDRERGARSSLAVTPEHVEAQANWRAFGGSFRERMNERMRAKPGGRHRPVAVVAPESSNHDHLGLYFVSLPNLDSA